MMADKRLENELWYGDAGRNMGTNVMVIYSELLKAMGTVVLIPTVMLRFSTRSQSPAKKRKRDKCNIRKVSCLLFLCFLYFYCFFEGKKVKFKKVPTTFQKPTPLLFQYFFHAF